MKFNDQKEVEIKSTKKKEEKSEEKKKLAAGDVKDALVGGVKGFYTVKDKKLRRKITVFLIVLDHFSHLWESQSSSCLM